MEKASFNQLRLIRVRILIIAFLTALPFVTVELVEWLAYRNYQLRSQIEQTVTTIEHTPTPLTPTSITSPTAGWKTYTGLGFSLKYPPNWSIPTTTQLSTRTMVDFNNTITVTTGIYYNQDLMREINFEEFLERLLLLNETPPQDYFLGNFRGKKILYENNQVLIALAKSNLARRIITIEYEHPDDPEVTKTIEQILLTLELSD